MDAGTSRILIVDDEHLIADTLGLIFSTKGYQVRVAYSAEEAIETIAEWLPDLMIIDVMLPGMNGVDLAILLRTQFPSCRMLLVSGMAATAELLSGASSRGHRFEILAKPVPPNDLLDAALRILGSDTPDGSSSISQLELLSAEKPDEPLLN